MLETLLQFRNPDSTENLNARLSGLIPKGIVKGGVIIPEPASLQVRIKGDGVSPFIILAFASDGMVVRERNEEHVLPIQPGIASVIALRAKYVEALGSSIARFEVLPLGTFQNDPDPDSLIRLCLVSPPAGATSVLSEHINMSFRDGIEGFTRRIVRDVVATKEDLPSVSGFPSAAEVNFLHNNFALSSSITMSAGAGYVSFPLVPSVNFKVASPSSPGLSRMHPSQKSIVTAAQSPLTGLVTVVTSTPHNYVVGDYVRISGNSATQINQVWLLVNPPSAVESTISSIVENLFYSTSHGFSNGLKVQVTTSGQLPTGILEHTNYFVVVMSPNTFKLSSSFESALLGIGIVEVEDAGVGAVFVVPQVESAFFFSAPLTLAWSGTGGIVVDLVTPAAVVAKMASGVLHSLVSGSSFTLTGASDKTFDGNFTVIAVVDAQTFLYTQIGYPTADSGNGIIYKEGGFLPSNAIEVGESATATALNFETAFNSSPLAADITAMAIGSSLQFMAKLSGIIGNSYTLSKSEPGVSADDVAIVLSGYNFAGGVDPNPAADTLVDLIAGDLYIVLFGSTGTMEIWGYDGIIFRNLTSATTATLLDFHRRNQFLNEKHVSENEKAALAGSVGVPSATNKYLTQQDTSTLTLDLVAALTGADNAAPNSNNRYLTEARRRGIRGEVVIPSGQDYVEVPKSDVSSVWSILIGRDNSSTDSTRAIPFFNVVFTTSLYDPIGKTDRGGPTEYSQVDFSPVVIDALYVTRLSESVSFAVELNPSEVASNDGIFPRADALLLNLPSRLWVKLNKIPNNGSATLLYSKAITEKTYRIASDMLAMPQRLLPAQVQDIINRSQELRFNAGINASGKTVTFPANLFTATNVQGYTLTRFAGSRAVKLSSSFSINFETAATTGDVDAFSLLPFKSSSDTLNKWTKYLLVLTAQNRIRVRHISDILEKNTDLGYAEQQVSVACPSLPFSDGSYVFAAINVKSSGSDNTTSILNLLAENIELYPYQASNSRDYGTPIFCGDGITSFGHFTGQDAHIRALAFAEEGCTIKLGKGVYVGKLIINKNNITIDGGCGAVLTSITDTAIVVVKDNFICKNISFTNCSVAIDLQGGARHTILSGLTYDSSVVLKLKAPTAYSFSPSAISTTPNNFITLGEHSLAVGSSGIFTTTGTLPSGLTIGTTYYVINPTPTTIQLASTPNGSLLSLFDTGLGIHTFGTGDITNIDTKKGFNIIHVSDGSGLFGIGDFNSVDGIQQAHNAAGSGSIINILPGTYNSFTVIKDRLQFKGIGGSAVLINGQALSAACITVVGSYNQFDNLTLENSAIGIDCQVGSTFNTFSTTVTFSSDVQTYVKMPQTDTVKSYNYHPLVCGRVTSGLSAAQKNVEVTVGDGGTSYGDYVGWNAINVALANESEGTRIRVFPGTYAPILLQRNNFVIEGSGARSIIRASAATDDACITIVNVPPTTGGAGSIIKGFYLVAENNESYGFKTVGIKITGDDNYISDIKFEEIGQHRIEINKKYLITSGFRNKFIPHTGAPTGYVSWTVGDGYNSFGDFNGGGGITQALNALATYPKGTSGIITSASGSTAVFSTSEFIFSTRFLYRYLCLQSGVNAGSYKIINCQDPFTEVTIERTDVLSFVNEFNINWNITAGAKIWVLPGQYDPVTIPAYRSDIELEAWGAGSDTLIVGKPTDTSLLRIEGHRCHIKGFRLAGGNPTTCVAVELSGTNNTLENNVYETPSRYVLTTTARNNKIYDSFESQERTYITVANLPSRGDFVGVSQQSLQDALNALDSHINKVVLGKGLWIFTSTIVIPSGVVIEGSGFATELRGDGSFPAFTLHSGGRQVVSNIRFNNFSRSLSGSASGVFAYGNWLDAAPIDAAVSGHTTMNI